MSTQAPTRTRKANIYAGTCHNCGGHVAAQAGLLGSRVNGRWTVQHTECPTATLAHSAAPAYAPAYVSPTRTGRSHECESCGAPRAHRAIDMSGIAGYACYRCDDGSLSLS